MNDPISDKLLSNFLNESISNVSYSANTVMLSLSQVGYIQFSGQFTFKYDGNQIDCDEVYPIKHDLGLLSLLEQKITKINQLQEEITFEFERDSTLTLYSDDLYESYTLLINGKEFYR